MHRMRIQMQASKDHDHEFEQLSTAVTGRGLNSTCMECMKEGILAAGGLEQPKIEKITAKRRQCPPDAWSEGAIVSTILKNYTKMLPIAEDPIQVLVEIHVQDMDSINEISSDFNVDILFSQLWHDPSLSFAHLPSCKKNITMESKHLHEIWGPNICLINSKNTQIHKSPGENVMVILYENGTVWINHRLSVKAPCNLDLRQFPFDVQNCLLIFESYSHNSEEVELHWMSEPVTLMKPIELPDFDLERFHHIKDNNPYPNGRWDQLRVTFTFKRRWGFYVIQAYVPTYLTIVVSWVSFCMEPKALPARTTVGISSLLALTFQFGNILKNLPRVSYVKAMDVWMLGCISFVFGTMLELAFVCYITRCQNSARNAERRRDRSRTSQIWANGSCRSRGNGYISQGNGSVISHYPSNSTRQDSPLIHSQHNSSITTRTNGPPSPVQLQMTTFDSQVPLTFNEIRSISPMTGAGSCIARFHPEAIDKFSIVAFPLAFTIFNMRLYGLVANLIVLQQTDCLLKELYAPSGDDNPGQNQQSFSASNADTIKSGLSALRRKALQKLEVQSKVDRAPSDVQRSLSYFNRPRLRAQVRQEGDSLHEVNQKAGLNDYLYQSDILLTPDFFYPYDLWGDTLYYELDPLLCRFDRDASIQVLYSNIQPEYVDQFEKESPATNFNYYLPYDYGSIMQYGAYSATRNDKPTMLSKDPLATSTLGSDMVAFYDVSMMNEHYMCKSLCSSITSAQCQNGGFPNPRNCQVCICPSMFGGSLCDRRPDDCGAELIATADWQWLNDTIGDGQQRVRLYPLKCHYWISSPESTIVEVDPVDINAYSVDGCVYGGIEYKTQADLKKTGYRLED
ncbi:hypothetical protein WR25_12021 [Diploscapter pachys]|uniref:Peptidase M12A domain-containing protein n=1 Tax=Diploscapter pachys TaxID=2018661 RepID=A0A2A2KCH4_9BILA|nr:hypothetical protein WR25_12021 [Diploscapter pachys]